MSPPVISDRELYLVGFGIDRFEENGSFLICCKTIDNDLEFQEKYKINIPKTSKYVRVDVPFTTMEITPIS